MKQSGQAHSGEGSIRPRQSASVTPGGQVLHAVRAEAEAEPDATPTTPLHAHAANLLPAELLQPGELIILLLKPSVWFIILGSLRFLGVVGIVVLGMLWLSGPQGWQYLGRRDILILGAIACSARLFWQFLVWLSHVYVLTDRRIIRVYGVLRVSVFETALKQVQHTTAYFSIRERLFGLGSIGFATAGTAVIETWWLMVNNPLEVHRTIAKTLSRYR